MRRFAAFVAVAVILFAGILISPAGATPRAIDDFNDNSTNLALWETLASGGPTVAETNQRLELALPATSQGQVFWAGYRSHAMLRGDFDIQVDYWLVDWPTGNGVRVGLEILTGGVLHSMQRGSYSLADEWYLTDFSDGPWRSAVTSDRSGKLRMTRVGSTLSGYYWNGSSWTLARSASERTDEVAIELAAWSHDNAFRDTNVKIAFDNLTLNSGTLVGVPEPSSLLGLGSGLLALMGVVRRRK